MATATATPSLRELEKALAEQTRRLEELDERQSEIAARQAEIAERLVAIDAEEEAVRLAAARAGLAGSTKSAETLAELENEGALLEHEASELTKEAAATSSVRSEAELEHARAAFELAEARAQPLRGREREQWKELGALVLEVERVWGEMLQTGRELERVRSSLPAHIPGVGSEQRDALMPVARPYPTSAFSALMRAVAFATAETPMPADHGGELRELLPRVGDGFYATHPSEAAQFSGVPGYTFVRGG